MYFKINHTSNYPNYIYNSEKNIDTEKRYFRGLASNYELDNNDCLYIKKYFKNTNNNKMKNYELLKVPFLQNLEKYIYDIHKNLNHSNHNIVRKEIIKNNYFFKGITKTVKHICKNCAICNIKSNIKIQKREKTKLIIFNKPKYRYIIDLTDIPTELTIGTNYKYLINIIDHFSKYTGSYLLENKTGNLVKEKIKNFLDEEGNPLEIGFDNGKEFLNKYVINFLYSNKEYIILI